MSRANPRFRRSNPLLPAAVPNLWKVSVLGTVQGQRTINTFYYADGGAALTSSSEGNLWAAFVTSIITPDFLQIISQDWTLIGGIISCLTSPTRRSVQMAAAPGVVGLSVTAALDTMLTITIDRYSAIKSQCGRGRLSVPAVPSGFVTAGTSVLNATGQTAVAANIGFAKNGFTAGTVTYSAQIVSHGTRVAPGGLGASPVIDALFNVTLGTCRRRKIGRGI